MTFSDKTLKDN